MPAAAASPHREALLAVLEVVAALAAAALGTVSLTLLFLVFVHGAPAAVEGASWRELLDPEQILGRSLPALLTIQASVFLGLGLVLMRGRVRREVRPERFRALGAVLTGGVAAGVAFVLSSAIGFALRWLGMPVEEQPWVLELAEEPGKLLRLAPWVVILAPVSEEVFLRGYVFRFLAQRAGLASGYVVSAGLFSLIHFNPSGFVVYMAIGLVLAVAYHWSSNLLAPVVGHMGFNAIVLAGLLAGAR
jgi:membrane protease YdiL (CAAX protease family)